MTPYYDHGGITIYHGDCREVLPTIEADTVCSDPPYGMNNNSDYTRFSGGEGGQRRRRHARIAGDDAPFDPTPWLAFPRVLLWGANHFGGRLPVGTTLVWIKRSDEAFGSFLSDAEVGWMKGGHGVYCRRDLSIQGESSHRLHPNQKPLGLMRWCLQRLGGTGTVLDPFMGSGSTLRAAKDLGRRAIGIELDERYCEIAAKRLSQEVLFA